jgi:hypothetical protein
MGAAAVGAFYLRWLNPNADDVAEMAFKAPLTGHKPLIFAGNVLYWED